VQARANGTVGLARLDLSEPAAETVHEALRPLPAQPAAPGALVHARLVGPQIPAGFVLLDPWGTPRAPLALSRNQRGAARADFVGTFSPEGGSVRVAAAGLDPDGNLWVRTFPTPFRIEGVEVRPESPPPTIAPGSGAQVAFRVRNHGPAGVFRVRVVDGLGLVRRVEPAELALAPGGSGLVTAEVQAPAVPPGSGEVLVVATATRASDPTIENGAALPVVIAPR
jgi:hypothetical protein